MSATAFPDFLDKSGMEDPTNGRLMGRLYNFETGVAALNDNHKAWIRANLAPLFSAGGGTLYGHLWGYASKVGNAGFNQRLSEHRAEETKKYLATLVPAAALANVVVGGYGTTHSGGGAHDNSSVYRGVDVYVKRETAPTPKPPPKPHKPPVIKPQKTVYLGLGLKWGGFVALAGCQALEAYLFSVDDYDDRFLLNAQIIAAGVGGGGSYGCQLVVCYGGAASYEFIGCKFGGWDFNINVAGHWGELAKAAGRFPMLVKIAKFLQEAKLTKLLQEGKLTKGTVEQLLKLTPDQWKSFSDLGKTIKDKMLSDPSAAKPQVNTFDLPLPPPFATGLEVDIFYGWGTVLSVE